MTRIDVPITVEFGGPGRKQAAAESFYWYDYETTGLSFHDDRIVQFAGQRTDTDLRPTGEPEVLYCQPAPDCIPTVQATLLHGITPQAAMERGLPEHAFADRIRTLIRPAGTCVTGWGARGFDHPMTQHLFFRNCIDPYSWHWRNGRTKWDVADVFRAAFALEPEGLDWPDPPVFHLGDMARMFGVGHAQAHTAHGDVTTMLALARIIRDRRPALWDTALELRDKHHVKALLDEGAVVHVSGTTIMRTGGAIVGAVVGSDDRGGTLLWDMTQDDPGEAIYRIRANAAPFVTALDRFALKRVGLTPRTLRTRIRAVNRKLKQLGGALPEGRAREPDAPEPDPVDDLFGAGFIPNADRGKLRRLQAKPPKGAPKTAFEDARLPELVFRWRARSFHDRLTREEWARWKQHCAQRLFVHPADERRRTRYDRYLLERERYLRGEEGEFDTGVLRALDRHVADIRAWCHTGNGAPVIPAPKQPEPAVALEGAFVILRLVQGRYEGTGEIYQANQHAKALDAVRVLNADAGKPGQSRWQVFRLGTVPERV